MLRFNSNVHNFKEMTEVYKKSIRYFINYYLPQNDFDLKSKIVLPEYILADDAYKVMSTKSQHQSNFEQVNISDKAENVFCNLFYSIKNLRKNTIQIDMN